MATIAIIGGPASGKTVVAGLMYEAVTIARTGQIKEYDYYPSEEDLTSWFGTKRDDKFDLEMGSDETTLNYLKDHVISQLRTGEFPPATSPTELHLLRFNFRIPSLFRTKNQPIGIYEIGGERVKKILSIIAEAKDKGTILRSIKGEDILRTLLQSEVIIVLVNSELCIPLSFKDIKEAKEISKKQTDSDFDTAILLTAIRNYKQHMGEKIKALGILFTMHDKVMNVLPLNTRQQYEDVIRTSMRSTWTQFCYIKDDYKIDNVKYFKSGIHTSYDEEEEIEKPAMPLRFYIRDYLDLLYWLIRI
jgi:hypothetical protein